MGHWDIAGRIIGKSKQLMGEYNERESERFNESQYLKFKGFMRCVTTDYGGLLYQRNDKNFTSAQSKTVKDLAKFYQLELGVD